MITNDEPLDCGWCGEELPKPGARCPHCQDEAEPEPDPEGDRLYDEATTAWRAVSGMTGWAWRQQLRAHERMLQREVFAWQTCARDDRPLRDQAVQFINREEGPGWQLLLKYPKAYDDASRPYRTAWLLAAALVVQRKPDPATVGAQLADEAFASMLHVAGNGYAAAWLACEWFPNTLRSASLDGLPHLDDATAGPYRARLRELADLWERLA